MLVRAVVHWRGQSCRSPLLSRQCGSRCSRQTLSNLLHNVFIVCLFIQKHCFATLEPMRLYLFELGRIATGEPILGYLVRTLEGKHVLIDTGYRPGTLGEATDAASAFLQAGPEQIITSQLARLGLSPDDINYVVVSHLDPDHAGFTDAFPSAEVVI